LYESKRPRLGVLLLCGTKEVVSPRNPRMLLLVDGGHGVHAVVVELVALALTDEGVQSVQRVFV